MDIKILSTFDNVKEYLEAAERKDSDQQELWQKYMIDPFWPEISQWAPFDMSYMKPKNITNIAKLKEQLSLLSAVSVEELSGKFTKITKALPKDDDDPMIVALYPLCDSNTIVKERQNGVVGACVFGNIIININPLARDWQDWISYVFAHEYHHCVWGHTWFVLKGGQGLEGSFLEYMLNEGQADVFAKHLFPHLTPQWNQSLDKNTEMQFWEKIKPILFSKDPQIHSKYMFGDESEGLPWCIGYSFGKAIVENYLHKQPDITFSDLIGVPPMRF
ncbi:MAG TPA: DUF2268 domain-containing putative Zn-dependent protease [Oscillospiraceae bacterium]|mgnify:CR=1 FL=1|nr:DUF2268 domain-containing putative Zn-dependent protease [Oscillospiraceae bacterium]HPS34755.1 DUF2268 domain-containing putative Zn-dependent protease [Oscillospiraceae bacterium]